MRVPSITEARTMETIVINLTCSYSDLSTMFHKDQRAYNTQIRATMVNRTERERERAWTESVFDTCIPSYNRIIYSIISSNSRLSSKELRWTTIMRKIHLSTRLEETNTVDHFARNCIVRHFHRVIYMCTSLLVTSSLREGEGERRELEFLRARRMHEAGCPGCQG